MLHKTIPIIVSCFLLSACSPALNQQQKLRRTSPDFNISFGEEGGFTGGYNGYSLDNSAQVNEITSLPGKEKVKTALGILTKKQLKNVHRAIDESHFFKHDYHERGNVTFTIKIICQDSTHSVSWPINDSRIDPQLAQLKKTLLDVVSTVKQ